MKFCSSKKFVVRVTSAVASWQQETVETDWSDPIDWFNLELRMNINGGDLSCSDEPDFFN